MNQHRYQAFISYSHSADGAFAPALQRGLQQFGRSWRQRRAMEVFRDETGLAVDPNLWGAITTALDASEWFVLLASPQAAASHWVGQEIEHCVSTKSAERILIVLTEGTLRWDEQTGDFTADSDAAHPVLRGLLAAAPTIIDLSWARNEIDLTLDNMRFRADVARIVALLRDEPLRTVTERDTGERRRTKTVVRSALGSLAAVTVVAVVAAVTAGVSWQAAAVEQAVAEEEARVALARELAAKSSAAEDPRAALALAVEAYALEPVAEFEGALLTAVSGTGASLVDLPALLPAGYLPDQIRSSSSVRDDDDSGRLTLSTATGSVAIDLATGQEWMLPGQKHYLMPDGRHAIGIDGAVLALNDDGSVDVTATVPALGTEPAVTAGADLFAYRHDAEDGSRLVVADVTGESIRSVPVQHGSECAGCSGDASMFAIAPDGATVAARIGPSWAQTPIRARVTTYAVTEELSELASTEVAGVGGIRFSDNGANVWARDDGSVLVLDPDTLEPAGEAMSVGRAGALRFASDTAALAPIDGCALPGVMLVPTMATIAELPAEMEFTEVGCIAPDIDGGEPRWVLDGSWVRTSAGLWPTDAARLLEVACAGIGGTVEREEFIEFAGVDHTPSGCSEGGRS